MTQDISTLGIAVDSTPVKAAAKDLDALTAAGGRAETAGKGIASTWSRTGQQIAGDTARIVKQLEDMNRQQDRTNQLLAQMAAAAKGQSAALGSIADSTAAAALNVRDLGNASDKTSKSVAATGAGFSQFGTILQALALGAVAKQFFTMADEITNVDSRLRLVTRSSSELAQVQGELFRIAQQTRTGYVDLATTYSSLARSAKEAGASTDQLLGVTQTISQALTISGASAASSNAALVQLGQGFASGTLRGEELNSVLEQTPRLAQAIADGLGVSIGQLRAMGAEGKLTSEAVLGALEKAAKGVSEEFERMTPTVTGSITKINNSMLILVGTINDTTGASRTLAGVLGGLSTVIDSTSKGLKYIFATSTHELLDAANKVRDLKSESDKLTRLQGTWVFTDKDATRLRDINAQLEIAKTNLRALDPKQQSASAAQSNFRVAEIERENAAVTQLAKSRIASDKEVATIRGDLLGVDDKYLKQLKALEDAYKNGSIKTEKEYTDLVSQLATKTYEKSEAGKAAAKSAREGATADKAANRELENQQKLLAELAGLTPTFYKDWANLTKQFEQGKLSTAELTFEQQKLLEKQPAIRKEFEATAKVMKAQYADQVAFAEEVARGEVEQSKSREAGRLAVDAYARAIDESNNFIKFEQTLAGKSERDRNIAIEQYRIELELKKQIREIDANPGFKEEDRVEERARATEAAARASAAVVDKVTMDEWKKTTAAIESSLTDALLRGFESGKGFGKNLRDTLFNLFRTLVLRPIISAIISPVSGAISGVVNNILGIAGSGTSSIGSLFNMASSANSLYGFYTGNSVAGNIYAGAANVYNGGTFAAGYNAAGSAAAGSAEAVSGLDIAGAGYSGTATAGGAGAGSSIAGLGWAAAAIVAVMAAVGAFAQTKPVNYGVQGSIGETEADNNLSAYTVYRTGGSLIDGPAYSSDNTPLGKGSSSSIQTAISRLFAQNRAYAAILGLDGSRLDGFTSTFGDQVLHPDFSFNSSIEGALPGTRTNGILSPDGTYRPGTPTLFGSGASTDAALIGLDLTGKSQEEQEKLIAEAIKKYNDALANQIFGFYEEVSRTVVETIGYGQQYVSSSQGDNGYFMDDLNDPIYQTRVETGRVYKENENSKYIHEGESAGDALSRLANSLQTVNRVLDAFGGTVDSVGNRLFKASLAGADMASQLVDLFGGLDKFNETTMAYFGAYYTQAEQEGVAREQLAASFRAINVAMPQSNAAFRALVESQDLTTDGGRRTYASLLQLSGAFATLYPLVDDATTALQAAEDARNAAFAALQAAIEARKAQLTQERDAVAATVANLQSLFDYLRAASRELYAEVDSTRAAAGSDGRALIAAAAAGGALPSRDVLAQAVTDARATMGEENYVSRADSDRDRLVLAGQLETIGDATGAQLSTAEQTLASLDRQIQQLDQTLDYWKQQVDAANGNLDATISVEEAIRTLQALMFPVAATATGPQGAEGKNPALFTGGGMPVGDVAAATGGSGFSRDTNIGGGFFGVAVTDPAEIARLTEVNAMFRGNTGSVADFLGAVRAAGGSLSDVQAATGFRYEDVLAAATAAGVPAFDVGTNYVPQDMLAVVHKGEAIVPAPYNSNNSGLADTLAAVVAELREMKSRIAEGNAHAQRTANAVNGRGDAPQLVEMAQ